MKTYKEFVSEIYAAHAPVVSISKNHVDLNKDNTVNEVNKNLRTQLNPEFESLFSAISKIKKVLSMYSIELGDIADEHEDSVSGKLSIPIHQSIVSGEKHSGIVTSPEDSEEKNERQLEILYTQGKLGYKVIAKII